MAGGRPSKIKQLDEKFVKRLFRAGLTENEVCKMVGIDRSSLTKFKQRYPEFFTTLKDWKETADAEVERSLYERALGYEVKEEKIFCNNGEIVRAETIRHYPPDPTSMIFWLKNRKPEQWRDKQEHSFEGIDSLLAEIRKEKSENK